MIQATPPVPLGVLRSPNILRDGQLVLTIPTNRGGRAAPLGDASDPLVRLEHSPGSCDGPVSACHEDTRAPWCRQSSQNTGYSLRLLGEPMPRFSRPTITGPHLGVPAAIWRGVLERFRTYLQPGFEYPMQHRFCGSFGHGPASGVFRISCHMG